jgi:hypothetical protein
MRSFLRRISNVSRIVGADVIVMQGLTLLEYQTIIVTHAVA